MVRKGWIAAAGAVLLLAAWCPAQQVPRKLPEFAVNMVNAKPVPVSQYKGKPLVMMFMLTTCPHCQHTVEMLSKMLPAYKPRGLNVLAAAIDDKPQGLIPGFLAAHHPAFPLGYVDAMAALDIAGYSRERLPHVPLLLFIDRQGTVGEQHEGADSDFFGDQQEDKLKAAIEALLTGGAKPVAKKAAKPVAKTVAKK